MIGRERFSHGRGRWFNPSRAHQVFLGFFEEKTEAACPDAHAGPDGGAGSSPPPPPNTADPAQVAALLQIGRESASGRLGSIKAMRMAGAGPAVFEAAIRALHAQIPFLTRWWRGYGESATAPFDHILIELCRYLERCDYRDELMIFNQAHWRAVRRQQRAASVSE